MREVVRIYAAQALRDHLIKQLEGPVSRLVSPEDMTISMSRSDAASLASMRNFCGQVEFPGLTEKGGRLCGIKVRVHGRKYA